jgi:hypothetical protein
MKKLIFFSILSSFLFASIININQGWNNIGFSKEYNIKKITDNKNFKYVWYFNPVNKKWEFYSYDETILNYATKNNFKIIPDILPKGSAVWIYSDNNTSIGYYNFHPYNITYYDNVKYAIGKKGNNLYLAESNDENQWNKFILLETNFTRLNNSLIYVGENKNDVLFSYTMTKNNNSALYVGSFDGEKISKKLIKEGYIYPYWNRVFTDPDNNATQYILFDNDVNGSIGELIIAKNDDKNQWSVQTIENLTNYDLETNPKFIYRKNSNVLTILRSFSVTTVDPIKTLIFTVKNGIHKGLELNGLWRRIFYHCSNDGNSYFYYVKTYNRSCAIGKYIKLIKNGNECISTSSFDHSIVAMGGVNDNELYAFGHDGIGNDLYIYKSTDGGNNWNLFKTVSNFNYQINYIEGPIKKDSDGKIYCRMRVNHNSFDIESKDSFDTWEKIIN